MTDSHSRLFLERANLKELGFEFTFQKFKLVRRFVPLSLIPHLLGLILYIRTNLIFCHYFLCLPYLLISKS